MQLQRSREALTVYYMCHDVQEGDLVSHVSEVMFDKTQIGFTGQTGSNSEQGLLSRSWPLP